ncbi:hypothetical protein JYG30_19750 [Fibrella sp. USSR17]
MSKTLILKITAYLLVYSILGCKQTSEPSPSILSECVLVSSITKSVSGTQSTSFVYSSDGLYTKIFNNGRLDAEFVYDIDKYLTSIIQYYDTGKIAYVSNFEYSNGNLSKQVRKTNSGIILDQEIFSYDSNGHLSKYFHIATDPNVISYTEESNYLNGQQIQYVRREGSNPNIYDYVFERGLVRKVSAFDYQTNFIYDEKDRLMRREDILSGRISRLTKYEYDEGINLAEAVKLPRGWPIEKRQLPYKKENFGLLLREQVFDNGTYKIKETSYEHVKNRSGFPIKRKATIQNFITVEESGILKTVIDSSTFEEIYTYYGCQ